MISTTLVYLFLFYFIVVPYLDDSKGTLLTSVECFYRASAEEESEEEQPRNRSRSFIRTLLFCSPCHSF